MQNGITANSSGLEELKAHLLGELDEFRKQSAQQRSDLLGTVTEKLRKLEEEEESVEPKEEDVDPFKEMLEMVRNMSHLMTRMSQTERKAPHCAATTPTPPAHITIMPSPPG